MVFEFGVSASEKFLTFNWRGTVYVATPFLLTVTAPVYRPAVTVFGI